MVVAERVLMRGVVGRVCGGYTTRVAHLLHEREHVAEWRKWVMFIHT